MGCILDEIAQRKIRSFINLLFCFSGTVLLSHLENLHAQLFAGREVSALGDHFRTQFYTQNFDDDDFLPWDLSKGKFTNILAIESLSYSRNVDKLLKKLHKSMDRGGILIMVDDVVLSDSWQSQSGHNNPHQHIADFKNLSQRPTLLTHEEWKKTFIESGFQVLHVRDLDLEFGLDHSEPTLPWENDRIVFRLFWRHIFHLGFFIFELSEVWWTKLIEKYKDHYPDATNVAKFAGFLRLLQLRREVRGLQNILSMRRQAFSQAALSYNLYVCRKITK